MKTLIALLILGAVLYIIVVQTSEIERRRKFREKYQDLCDFYHFVGTCKGTDENKSYITDRIKSERARKEACTPEYMGMLNMIEHIFTARFEKR